MKILNTLREARARAGRVRHSFPSVVARITKIVVMTMVAWVPSALVSALLLFKSPFREQLMDSMRVMVDNSDEFQITFTFIDFALMIFSIWFFVRKIASTNRARTIFKWRDYYKRLKIGNPEEANKQKLKYERDRKIIGYFVHVFALVAALVPTVGLAICIHKLGDGLPHSPTLVFATKLGAGTVGIIVTLLVASGFALFFGDPTRRVSWLKRLLDNIYTCWPYVLVFGFVVGIYFFARHPYSWGSMWGPLATLFTGILAWTSVLSLLKIFSESRRIPVFSWLLASLVVASAFNFQRYRQVEYQVTNTKTPTIGHALDSWLQVRENEINKFRAAGRKYPIFLVSAEGGGIRAAAHVLETLSVLQDKNPKFLSHTFLISGVSGGSVGAAYFNAIASERLGENGELQNAKFEPLAREVLKADLLTPSMGRLFFVDIPACFVPYPLTSTSLDRSNALSEAICQSWYQNRAFKQKRLMSMTLQEFGAKHRDRLPYLVLNSASARTGGHRALSNIKISKVGDESNLSDLSINDDEMLDLRLCDAASLSARFPVITSTGMFPLVKDGRVVGQDLLVDGGYYENTGLSSMFEVSRQLLGRLGARSLGKPADNVAFIWIRIGSSDHDPVNLVKGTNGVMQVSDYKFTSTITPLLVVGKTLMGNMVNARRQRDRVISALKYNYQRSPHSGDTPIIEAIDFPLPEVDLLLGWQISGRTVDLLAQSVEHSCTSTSTNNLSIWPEVKRSLNRFEQSFNVPATSLKSPSKIEDH